MEVQSECVEPPVAPQCDPQPTGKINKAAFKLFGKRRTGSGMASFFSFRNKGATNSGNNGNSDNGNSLNGNSSVASVELVRSKTHDGLTSNDADGQRGEGLASLEAGPVRSLSKSLSFFSLLRRGSFRSGENGGVGIVRRGRGLKGFFSSMRWRRKEKASEGEGEEVDGKKEKDAADSDKVKDITLTLEPPPHHHQEDCENAEARPNLQATDTPMTSVTMTPTHCVAMPGPSGEPDSPFPYTPTDSPLRPSIQKAKASISSLTPSLATPPLDRCSTGDPPSEPSVDRLCSLLFTDVTSLKSFDSLTGCGDIIADADEEGPVGNGGSGTSSSSSGGGGGSVGPSIGKTVGISSATSCGSPSKPPLPSQITQSMFSVSQSSACASLPARTRVPPPPQQHPAGSGVVAYMGGGEEMASPEGVDDADMQGLWHMLPSTGDNSPALPRLHQPSSATPTSTYPPRTTPASSHLPSSTRSADRKAPQVKALGLSKIPVVGGSGSRAAKPPLPHTHGRHPTSPGEKEPLSDEGYWDTPSATPTATPDETGLQRDQKIALSRDSCSGDHLYDLYNEPEEEGEDHVRDEDLNSTPSPSTEYKMSPTSQTSPPSSSSSSSFRSMKGSTSLPRESKIPVSTKQASPPHSVSQSALSSVLEAESPPSKTQPPPPARTRIPVSKVPVRRSGNKPGSTTRGAAHKK
ncbi:APC membrane recruitment protein 2 [Melanotaenia boesemani]|uniref:APC membrane recruitment protein 2 n=1 Tax=Melanotaenia boesemani TaxID=1250792 RepID=UPI001C049C1F|nr:APC membrane recruitment protein 2 [Melanotaenia boesemani]